MVLQNLGRLDLAHWFTDAVNGEQSGLVPLDQVPQ
jgi:hypothetical protein